MFCKFCGKEIPDESTVCIECGATIAAKKDKKFNFKFIIPIVAVFIIIIVIKTIISITAGDIMGFKWGDNYLDVKTELESKYGYVSESGGMLTTFVDSFEGITVEDFCVMYDFKNAKLSSVSVLTSDRDEINKILDRLDKKYKEADVEKLGISVPGWENGNTNIMIFSNDSKGLILEYFPKK